MESLHQNSAHTLSDPNSIGLPGCSAGPLGECLGTAEKLSDLLKQEAEVLKKFASDDLLSLLPAKQILVDELRDRLETLRDAEGGNGSPEFAVRRIPLRNLLKNIQEQNRFNETFIRNTLEHWKDLMSIFFRSSYGPGQDNVARKRAFSRGRTLNMEV